MYKIGAQVKVVAKALPDWETNPDSIDPRFEDLTGTVIPCPYQGNPLMGTPKSWIVVEFPTEGIDGFWLDELIEVES